jgi:hypothetical protein
MEKIERHPFVMSVRPLKEILLGFFLFFYLYGVQFTFMPLSTARIIILMAYAYFAFIILAKPSFHVQRSGILLLLVYVIFLYWVAFMTVLRGAKDLNILISTSLLILHSFIGGCFFVSILNKMDIDFRKFILFLQVVIVVQAVFIIIYFVSWEFREFTFAYIPEGGNIDHRTVLFRSRGLTHSASAALSVLQSFGLLFTAFLMTSVKYRSIQFVYLCLSFGILILSVLLTGRTGLLMLPVIVVYFGFILITKKRIPKNITYFVLAVPVLTFLSYILFRYVYQNFFGGITTSGGEDVVDRVIRWYMVEFYEEGKLQSRTVSALKEHWFFPESSSELLFGDPATWSFNRIRSDVGVVRMWHGVGLIGIIIYYSLMLLLFIHMAILSLSFPERFMIILLGVFIFIIELKEPFMFSIGINSFFMLILIFVISRHAKSFYYSGNSPRK